MVSALDRFGMAQALVAAGADMIFGDFIFALDLDRPVRGLDEFEAMARKYLPDACKLTVPIFLSDREKTRSAAGTEISRILRRRGYHRGRFSFHAAVHARAARTARWCLTNTAHRNTTSANCANAALHTLVTTTPDFGGRSFGTNVVEAALLALLGKTWAEVTPKPITSRVLRGAALACRASSTSPLA